MCFLIESGVIFVSFSSTGSRDLKALHTYEKKDRLEELLNLFGQDTK